MTFSCLDQKTAININTLISGVRRGAPIPPPQAQQNAYFSNYLTKIILALLPQEIVERDCRLP